ncbi:DUF362 domain-containing protein [Eggerthella sp. YY7918]|uniref:DUF362 domain-containing protein n=1 Tax=Eggerthella sp. (strain YY7918) TaxID=502558 RepID=UPI00021715E6|nr:DUF362 domain-containing protein [Eggerthella sp. YY7918]BAK44405.1 hypothetical protein EGYY_12410 [Eggerthella sp. YY7918]
MDKATVYVTKDISPEGLMRAYQALNIELPGNVAVKISTGEPGGHNFLQPALIKDLVTALDGTIVECNTAYPGRRDTVEEHLKTFNEHGFTAIAPCDLMDEEGDFAIPVEGGVHLSENYVGTHLKDYDSMLVLSHFKGHAMGGFGGALKNLSIGVASGRGKGLIHCSGTPMEKFEQMFEADHDSFLESMADADKSVMDYMGRENIVYVNVANRLSVDCDCDANPAEPEMGDLGIFASLDPVALDQACVDAVYNSSDAGKAALIERMESRNGIHTVEAAAALKLGSRAYDLIDLDA